MIKCNDCFTRLYIQRYYKCNSCKLVYCLKCFKNHFEHHKEYMSKNNVVLILNGKKK